MHDHDDKYDDDMLHSSMDERNNDALTVSHPSDSSELQADSIAKKVAEGKDAPIINPVQSGSSLNKKDDGEKIQAPENIESHIDAAKGGGQYMEDATRSEMESKMGADFSGVKIHTDNNAHLANQGLGSKAVTKGEDILFRNGNYDPDSKKGKELLAHELVHTQQENGNTLHLQRDELDKLKTYDKSKDAKDKENAQQGVNAAFLISGDPVNKEDKNQLEKEKRKIEGIEKRIDRKREKYIRNLHNTGVKEDDTQAPFFRKKQTKRGRRLEKKIESLYEKYDQHAKNFNTINDRVRSDIMKSNILNETQKGEVDTYDLDIPGIDKNFEVSNPAKQTEELIKWSEVSARTSYERYHELISEGQTESTLPDDKDLQLREKQLNAQIEQRTAQIINLFTPHGENKGVGPKVERLQDEISRINSELELIQEQRNDVARKKELKEKIDSLQAQIINIKAKSPKANTEDLEQEKDKLLDEYNAISDKYRPPLSESEKAKRLMRGLVDHHEKDEVDKEDVKVVLKYYLQGELKDDDKLLLIRFLNKFVGKDELKDIVGKEKDQIDSEELLKTIEEHEIKSGDKYFKDPQRKNKSGGKRHGKEFVDLTVYEEDLKKKLENINHPGMEDEDEKTDPSSDDFWENAGEVFKDIVKEMDEEDLNMIFAFGDNFSQVATLKTAIEDYNSKKITLTDLQNATLNYCKATGHTPADDTEFMNSITGSGKAEEKLSFTINPGGEYKAPDKAGFEFLDKFISLSWKSFMATYKTNARLKGLIQKKGVKYSAIGAYAAGWIADAIIHQSPGSALAFTKTILEGFGLLPETEKKIYHDKAGRNGATIKMLDTHGPSFEEKKLGGYDLYKNEADPNGIQDMEKRANFYASYKFGHHQIKLDANNKPVYDWNTKLNLGLNYIANTHANGASPFGWADVFAHAPTSTLKEKDDVNTALNTTSPDMLNFFFTGETQYKTKNFLGKGNLGAAFYNPFGGSGPRFLGFDYGASAKYKFDLNKKWKINVGAQAQGQSGYVLDTPQKNINTFSFGTEANIQYKNLAVMFGYKGATMDGDYSQAVRAGILYNTKNFGVHGILQDAFMNGQNIPSLFFGLHKTF